MCLAIPLPVRRIENEIAWVGEEGEERPVSLLGVDGVVPGDYLLVHAGLALARLDPAEAEEILAALESVGALDAAEETGG